MAPSSFKDNTSYSKQSRAKRVIMGDMSTISIKTCSSSKLSSAKGMGTSCVQVNGLPDQEGTLCQLGDGGGCLQLL